MFIELTVVKRTIAPSPIQGAKPTEAVTDHPIFFNPDQIAVMEVIDHPDPEVGKVTMVSLGAGTPFPVRETVEQIKQKARDRNVVVVS